MNIDLEKLKRFADAPLLSSAHDTIADGGCVMEWAAYLANEPHSDSPACVSKPIAAFLRSWNDSLPDDKRQMLKPYALKVLGTAGTQEQEDRRSWMAMDWLIREFTPAWLGLVPSLAAGAASLRALPEITGASGVADVMSVLEPIRERSAAAWAAARAAAWAAAGAAARDAAWNAARDAAGAAARDAAGAAAWDAARDAAWDAARDAAWYAARDAAAKKLQPTVERLQASALALLDRMIAVTETHNG